MKIERGPLHPSFGAEVVGVNLARHLDEETIAAIENGWTPTVSCSSATSG
jgi:alpha-ketoglutarate-dependent taurine dioxygenase